MTHLEQLFTELDGVRASRRDLLENGQTVSVAGSHSYTKVRLAELFAEEKRLIREIAVRGGLSCRRTEAPRYEK